MIWCTKFTTKHFWLIPPDKKQGIPFFLAISGDKIDALIATIAQIYAPISQYVPVSQHKISLLDGFEVPCGMVQYAYKTQKEKLLKSYVVGYDITNIKRSQFHT